MSFMDNLIDKGKELGLKKGKELAGGDDLTSIALSMLTKKIGPLPKEVEHLINNKATKDVLSKIIEGKLKVDNLDDLKKLFNK